VSEQDIIRWAAKRAAEEPQLLGHELREYRALNDASEDELATALECSRDALVCLALCRRPDPNAASFRAEVEQIAMHCGANAQKLAALLREVDSLRTIRQVPVPPHVAASRSGLLAAARDRKRKSHPQKRGGKKRPGK
jgi:hypothetical protein